MKDFKGKKKKKKDAAGRGGGLGGKTHRGLAAQEAQKKKSRIPNSEREKQARVSKERLSDSPMRREGDLNKSEHLGPPGCHRGRKEIKKKGER